MATAIAFGIAVVACVFALRPVKRVGRWMGGAIGMFVAVYAITLGLQDVPSETAVTRAYRRGTISYNDYERGAARARAAYDYAGIAGGIATLALAGAIVFFVRFGAIPKR